MNTMNDQITNDNKVKNVFILETMLKIVENSIILQNEQHYGKNK